jgi:hypothetical protein
MGMDYLAAMVIMVINNSNTILNALLIESFARGFMVWI